MEMLYQLSYIGKQSSERTVETNPDCDRPVYGQDRTEWNTHSFADLEFPLTCSFGGGFQYSYSELFCQYY